jgi:hypothetical protein
VLIPALLLARILPGIGALTAAGLVCGFAFSWVFAGSRYERISGIIGGAGSLAVGVWMAAAVAGSSFGNSEVVLICLKGEFLLAVVLSFCAPQFSSLIPIQYLSLPLFLACGLFASIDNAERWVGVFAYLLIWVWVVRLSLSAAADIHSRTGGQSSGVMLVLFCACASAAFLAGQLPSGTLKAWELNPGGKNGGIAGAEDYYASVEQLQQTVMKRLSELESAGRRQQALLLVSALGNDSLGTLQTDEAEEGLISLFNTPGGGLGEKREDDKHFTIQTKELVRKKTALRQDRAKNDLLKALQRENVVTRFVMMKEFNAVRSSDSLDRVRDAQRRLRERIGKGDFSPSQKGALRDAAQSVAEWRLFELYNEARESAGSGAPVVQALKRELEVRRSARELQREVTHDPDALAFTKEQAVKAVSDVVSARDAGELKTAAGFLEKNIDRENPQQVQTLNELASAKTSQLNMEGTKKERSVRPPADIAAVITPSGIPFLARGVLCALLVAAVALMLALFFITRRAAGEIKALRSDPGRFIIALHENLVRVFMLFGLKVLPSDCPRDIAERAHTTFGISEGRCSAFTRRFEEAKFSRHRILPEWGSDAVLAYRFLLTSLFAGAGISVKIRVVLASLIRKTPLFI